MPSSNLRNSGVHDVTSALMVWRGNYPDSETSGGIASLII